MQNLIISNFINNATLLLDVDIIVFHKIIQKYKLVPSQVILTTKNSVLEWLNQLENYFNLNKENILAKFKNASQEMSNAINYNKKVIMNLRDGGIETIDLIKRKIYEYKIIINDLKHKNTIFREAQIKAYDEYLNPTLYNEKSGQTQQVYLDTQENKYKIFSLNWKENLEKIAKLESELINLEHSILPI